ncbi:MAG: hypothetical protein CUN50_04795 [Candidatus Thermofonsia Clade 1 bacterium]|uniref:Uncharacterized protein n=2 Tax=Candidatus Thermofonsia Clade 1 bacterium TaxID=2364210 RepID=A0A2M8PXL0_9CHLR|nr:MAG: hypothetical protein CUN50_04795 [Candidatus Thermofonsia Clade 1 bacterium]
MRGALLRRGLGSALSLGAEAAAAATAKQLHQRFKVQPPLTVYVRGSHVSVRVQRAAADSVILDADLHAHFGWEFVTDQDDAGVYIVARRKPLVGALSWATLSLTVPFYAHLALHLTPGSLHLAHLEGKLTLPATTS